ncbi:putative salicylate hydroxylase [Pseudomassariella vexata]|uniref:Putative salicylate hydroxylase n=1 Tax=Pseudomassariella vexata TaxID=1141098 RepID=A0A1Y2DJ02_9PEZI|nr:putative salicylate hydroxylase [Pseudomassariella vexata]ORY59192.1 putative salicylate hydroxylase [Pseudomassariella vexata]
MTSSSDQPPAEGKFRIAIIGSGPCGKLLANSVIQHPRIAYDQYEADKLPVRPSFGYGIGPQTLRAAEVLNPALGKALHERCTLSDAWLTIYHGGDENQLIQAAKVPEGKRYGRLPRQALLELLDAHAPPEHETKYGKQVVDMKKLEDGLLQLRFQDGSTSTANAVWGCDGMNSVCRRFMEGDRYKPADYSGTIAYRGRVPASQLSEEMKSEFASKMYMFLGVKGWHVQVNPIDGGESINIAAYALRPEYTAKGMDRALAMKNVLGYFPGRNEKVDKLLKLLISSAPAGPQPLFLPTLTQLEPFYNASLCTTTFGDAAHGMPPHLAASLSTVFLGVTTFLRDGLNPLIDRLSCDATNAEIADLIMEAAAAYDVVHRPLAQKLLGLSQEQGELWSGGRTEVEELIRRSRVVWGCADGFR